VIVGFPGETEEEFLTTYNFIKSLPISYLHVFTYSERENTKALQISPIVPVAERKKRNEMLRILSEKKKRAFYEENKNTLSTVLWESESDNERMFGFTENYIKVNKSFDPKHINRLQRVAILDFSESSDSMNCTTIH
jgi:threonylcarbamoyladenosine tRNA methylthiotransferase MtaB